MKLVGFLFLFQIEAVPHKARSHDPFDMSKVDCTKYTGVCTMEFRPLCANDGKTKPNPCAFYTDYCMTNPKLEFINWGQCHKK